MNKDEINQKFAEELVIIHIEASLGLKLASNLRLLNKSIIDIRRFREENENNQGILDTAAYVELALLRAKVEVLEA